jgi:hypothetical protein
MSRAKTAALVAALALAVLPAAAAAHLERAGYWPDPAADRSVTPAAGGAVPKARSLASALGARERGRLRVVCKPDSLRRAYAAIRKARAKGYVIRPSQGRLALSAGRAERLRRLNRELFRRCRHRHIQAAVLKARNNGRVVVMPGRYLEEPSRAKPTDDPACDRYENEDGSLSFRYHVNCPNDANLIYVEGRRPAAEPPPDPPRPDRHGIPDAGRCVRCNLQIEGSGVGPHDVRIDAAQDPSTPLRKAPGKYAKDVALRIDRADGVVVRNLTAAHAQEHGIYVTETDGYLIDRVGLFWNRAYGALMFTSDHGLLQNSDAAGSGDSSVYPGAAPDTGEQTVEPTQRINTVIRRNDLHRSAIGCSCAAMGNSILIKDNDAYDNGTGISADSLGAAAHPGFPQDSGRVVGNRIYSNNFNVYAPDSDVPPTYFTVVGVGLALWGGNSNHYEANRIWDNWRYGAMLFAIPSDWGADYLGGDPKASQSTSFNNRYTRNVMGIAPDGAERPNGIDFWWDSFPGTTGNRWCENAGAGGRVTSDPEGLPGCQGPSVGSGDPDNMAEFYTCAALLLNGGTGDPNCEWWRTPSRPGSQPAATEPLRLSALLGAGCELRMFAACGGDRRGGPPPAPSSGLSPAEMRKADCADWSGGAEGERRAAVRGLGRYFGQNLPAGSPAQTLPDADAYDLLDRTCSRGSSRDLLLWGVYMQAAGFSGYREAYTAGLARP